MVLQTSTSLDAEELLHLALRDTEAGKHDAAIEKLKQSLAIDAGNAKAQFLLAAEHAEIGLFDRAAEGLAKALELDPTLHVARFQLGLVHYSQNRVELANQIWAGLSSLGGNHSMVLFTTGLIKLTENNLADAIADLEQARDAETQNLALRNDIERVLSNARAKAAETSNARAPTTTDGNAASRLLANRYDDNAES